MTEITNNPKKPAIHVPAFVGALILGPMLSFPLLMLVFDPVVILVAGGLPYLLLGTPYFASTLENWGPNYNAMGLASLRAVTWLLPLSLCLVIFNPIAALVVLVATVFGFVIAPLWATGLVFVYRLLTR